MIKIAVFTVSFYSTKYIVTGNSTRKQNTAKETVHKISAIFIMIKLKVSLLRSVSFKPTEMVYAN